jgi:hypothetical protein
VPWPYPYMPQKHRCIGHVDPTAESAAGRWLTPVRLSSRSKTRAPSRAAAVVAGVGPARTFVRLANAAASRPQMGGASCARPSVPRVREGYTARSTHCGRGGRSASPQVGLYEWGADLVHLHARRQLFPPEHVNGVEMTTPAFTAEASLYRASASYRQVPLPPAADAELLGLAQLGLPVLPAPVLPSPTQPLPLTGLEVEVYGNWCGPGHSGPGAPIDRVDQVCCRHDKCYSNRGSLDCSCNRDLITSMPAAIADPNTSASGRAVGAAAMLLFSAIPCICHRACVPFVGCFDIPGPGGIPGFGGLCPPGSA